LFDGSHCTQGRVAALSPGDTPAGRRHEVQIAPTGGAAPAARFQKKAWITSTSNRARAKASWTARC